MCEEEQWIHQIRGIVVAFDAFQYYFLFHFFWIQPWIVGKTQKDVLGVPCASYTPHHEEATRQRALSSQQRFNVFGAQRAHRTTNLNLSDYRNIKYALMGARWRGAPSQRVDSYPEPHIITFVHIFCSHISRFSTLRLPLFASRCRWLCWIYARVCRQTAHQSWSFYRLSLTCFYVVVMCDIRWEK